MIEDLIGYQFNNKALLKSALLHPSALKIKKNYDFERLEFLGDRVLGLLMAEYVYKKFKKHKEGYLAQRQAALVSREVCQSVAHHINLVDYIQYNANDFKAHNSSILANTIEALIGAIYLDGGLEPCQMFIKKAWRYFQDVGLTKDSKSLVQEWSQKNGLGTPQYKVIESRGPDHSPVFKVEIRVDGYCTFFGYGTTVKQAEQEAAQNFLKDISKSKLKPNEKCL